jgi:hypothetical protein
MRIRDMIWDADIQIISHPARRLEIYTSLKFPNAVMLACLHTCNLFV